MVHQRHEQRVEPDHRRELPLLQLFDEAADVPRVGDQQVVIAADHHAHAITGERIDVIKRQRRHHDLAALLEDRQPVGPMLQHAGVDLLHVGDQIAMGQHRAFRRTGGAAGVLQHSDVVQRQRHPLQTIAHAQLQSTFERDRLRQMVGRHHLLDLFDHGVDQPAFGRRLHVAHLHFDQVLDVGVRPALPARSCRRR